MPIVRVAGYPRPLSFPEGTTKAQMEAALKKLPPAPGAPPAAPDGPGVGEAMARGAGQGATLGFGDEASAAVEAGLQKVLPEALGGIDYGKPFGTLYRENRDVNRRENTAARKEHPWAYGAGEMVGATPAAIATGGKGAASLLRNALQGAAFGAAAGVGGSEEAPGSAGITGAALGGAIGAGVPLVGRSVLLPLIQKLRDVGTNAGRRVLTRVSSSLSNRKGLSDEAVAAAREVGAFGPLKDTKYAKEVLEGAREAAGDFYAQVVAELEQKGVAGPKARELAARLAQEARDISANTLGSPRPGVFSGVADELMSKPTDSYGRLGLTQAESMKRELQHLARSEYDKLKAMQTPRGEAQEAVASRVREAIEASVDSQKALAPEAAAAFEPVKQKLGLLIQASNAARAGANRAQKNAAISLPDIVAGAGVHGPLAGLGMHVARTRGPSTVAWAAPGVADLLRAIADPATDKRLLAEMLRKITIPVAATQAGGIQ